MTNNTDAVKINREIQRREIQRKALVLIEMRLRNWGAWWFDLQLKPINQATGIRRTGLLQSAIDVARSLDNGPKRYLINREWDYSVDINAEDAELLHIELLKLRRRQFLEIERYYAAKGGHSTQPLADLRYRVKKHLINRIGIHEGSD